MFYPRMTWLGVVGVLITVPQRARSTEGDTKADEIAALVREFMRRGR